MWQGRANYFVSQCQKDKWVKKRTETTSKGCIFKSLAQSGPKEMIQWEKILINKHDYVSRTWVMFLFPPEISAEKEIEDWEPPLLQSFWPFFF